MISSAKHSIEGLCTEIERKMLLFVFFVFKMSKLSGIIQLLNYKGAFMRTNTPASTLTNNPAAPDNVGLFLSDCFIFQIKS